MISIVVSESENDFGRVLVEGRYHYPRIILTTMFCVFLLRTKCKLKFSEQCVFFARESSGREVRHDRPGLDGRRLCMFMLCQDIPF